MATVVIGYVPKPEGDAALLAGIEEAQRRSARAVVVHAMLDHEEDEPAYVGEVRSVLDHSGVDHDLRVLDRGVEASDGLIGVAEEVEAELIVIGLRRRSPVGKLILGTNAQRVMLDAPCPVLTVKPRAGRH
ncbi:universal stress protein [Nocardioides humilatus]|uniref:Universal stress protein n=1 Tax=Nocardioides humilatus TaxID=2607660 RepID=A0A5B1L6I2_9ACTN|nr:universal stress protein [Nocardioides humilatus]KAA1416311.1 universal stress protein [Nocardioides humilatus]